METTWEEILEEEKQKPYFKELLSFLEERRTTGSIIHPKESELFRALQQTPFAKVRVVILGQDPYHGPGQAHGLSFSVQPDVAIPPSLRNIYKEISTDIGTAPTKSGHLINWAEQGVFLLNAVLSVEEGKPGSHANKGWEIFTDRLIEMLASKKSNLVFLLWGSYAQKKANFLDQEKHFVLTAPHPSPLSAHRGFLGCQHFSKCNNYLAGKGLQPINWATRSD